MAIGDLQTVQTIELGRQGENLATEFQFDLLDFFNEYGRGTGKTTRAVLVHKRSGDSRPYIVAESENSYYLKWTVKTVDTLQAGTGYAEIRYFVDNLCVKSAVFNTQVIASLMDPVAEQPGSVVYVTSVGALLDSRVSSLENTSAMVIVQETNNNHMVADDDHYGRDCAGKAGCGYQFRASQINVYGGATPSLTMKLINGTTIVASVNITSADHNFNVIAPAAFTRIEITPHVEMLGISYTVSEISPIIAKINQMQADIAELQALFE